MGGGIEGVVGILVERGSGNWGVQVRFAEGSGGVGEKAWSAGGMGNMQLAGSAAGIRKAGRERLRSRRVWQDHRGL